MCPTRHDVDEHFHIRFGDDSYKIWDNSDTLGLTIANFPAFVGLKISEMVHKLHFFILSLHFLSEKRLEIRWTSKLVHIGAFLILAIMLTDLSVVVSSKIDNLAFSQFTIQSKL